MSHFRLAVFDLDGTLIDSRADIAAATNRALADHGLAPWPEAQIEPMIGDGARSLIERSIAGRLPPERTDDVLARYQVHYAAHRTVRTCCYPGVLEGLAALDRKPRIARAVATNKPAALARAIAADVGIAPLVDLLLGDGDVPRRKPDPAMLEAAMTRLGVDRAATLYVGDGPVDVLTARAAGVPLCLVGWGYRQGEPLASPPDFRAERFEEIVALLRS